MVSWTEEVCRWTAMTCTPSGHREQLLSGSWRAKVYAGKDPLTGREIRFSQTCKTKVEAQIELGKLLALAHAGSQPDPGVTVGGLLDQYVPVAGWDVSTMETNRGYIRRTVKPALGSKEVRKVRGPCWTTFTRACSSAAISHALASRSLEHRHVPDLRPAPSDPRAEWQRTSGSGKPSAAASAPPATRCRRCPTCPGSRGWHPAPSRYQRKLPHQG
jgi:hypothetical protein